MHKPSLTYFVLTAFFLIVLLPGHAMSTPEYAKQTGFACAKCHTDPGGGGALTETGTQFLETLKAKGQYRSLSLLQHIVRLFIGYLHLMSAIMWFGTIMYVHLLLKPAYASQGLPRGELRVGWVSMIIVLVTGILLTIARIPSFGMFYTTRFGILLAIKIFLFLMMFASAIVTTLVIGPRLRRKKRSPVAHLLSQTMTVEQLSHFDGKEGRPAYLAYKGIIYNVTQGRLWKNGLHVLKHGAGQDLTEILNSAPHGDDKVLAMPQVGTLSASVEKQKQPWHVRLFYFFAYMNLVLVFVIIFIIALWRWW
jgi:predicted heme/steroid binding protein/uncharacterized membrane protein